PPSVRRRGYWKEGTVRCAQSAEETWISKMPEKCREEDQNYNRSAAHAKRCRSFCAMPVPTCCARAPCKHLTRVKVMRRAFVAARAFAFAQNLASACRTASPA